MLHDYKTLETTEFLTKDYCMIKKFVINPAT